MTMETFRALMDALHHVFWKKMESVINQFQTNVLFAGTVNAIRQRFVMTQLEMTDKVVPKTVFQVFKLGLAREEAKLLKTSAFLLSGMEFWSEMRLVMISTQMKGMDALR